MSSENKNKEIIRSHRKTIAIIVNRDGQVIVRAPNHASNAQIQRFLDQKVDWIKQKQAEAIRRSAQYPPHKFIEGELFPFLGKTYPLRIAERGFSGVTFSNDDFVLVRRQISQAKELFCAWYRHSARQILSDRVSQLAASHHIAYGRIRITSARTRWGSCSSSGTLSFSWRLVMAPMDAIDYVIIHELAHMKERNHSRKFWAMVSEMMPEYQTWEQWLKINGRGLTLD